MFRNLTALCLGIWLALSGAGTLAKMWKENVFGMRRKREAPEQDEEEASGGRRVPGRAERPEDGEAKFGATDAFVLLYGAAVLVSALCSRYGETPWMGYREWYMGAVSQLMFVGIYFFVSRCYDGRRYPIVWWICGFFLVILFGALHRIGVDPLGLMRDFNTGDWTYSHMLSTVGNINWFCGYCSVAAALPTALFLRSKSARKRAALYPVSAAGLFLLFVQGSDIGVILTAVCLLVCLFWGLGDKAVFRRTFLLFAGMSFLLPCYAGLAASLGEGALAALPADSVGWGVVGSRLWWAAGAAALGIWLLLRILDRRGREKEIRLLQRAAVTLIFLGAAGGAAFFLARQPAGQMWGSGRGALWEIAVQGFWQGDPLQKLVGVGPDCFAEYIYTTYTGGALLLQEGRWAGAVYANAHNEWLNHLVNLGIMGTGLYMGIFVSAAARYRRCLAGILALAMYGAVSLTGFQQCISTPLLFLLLGMCESGRRRRLG